MGPDIFLAVALTLLVISLGVNGYLFFSRRRFEQRWLVREIRALDRAHASELRAAEQIDAMLDRVSSAPGLEIREVVPLHDAEAGERRAFFDDDDPTEQAAWNEYRTGSREDEVEA